MRTYPIMLLLAGRRVLLVGAGRVAKHKVDDLLACDAIVTVVAPDIDPAFDRKGVICIRDAYDAAHLEHATLVFACTDDATLNAQVVADARARNILACAVDQPADCDFYSPATLRDGDVVLAVGTGGAAPGLAKQLRNDLTDHLPEQIGAFAETLQACRTIVLERVENPARRKAILTALADSDMYATFLADGPDALHTALDAMLATES
jgi:precorrin-2 dehydrogenase / sirohydrochlorin ferrochelatase